MIKKILITGENSYIGNSLENWLMQKFDKYMVNRISVRESSWKEKDFSSYDVVVHVAGIAHTKETKKNKELYYKVNRDLAYEIAKKMKSDGVRQFVFLSTMSVYGIKEGIINAKTPLKPQSNYGKSKLEAENLIKKLEDKKINIAIIRPPMVYGKGCKGNYNKLSKFAKISPLFFDVENQRSMIYIENLTEFIRIIIEQQAKGVFHPQNYEYVSTTKMVREIASIHQRQIHFTKLFNPFIKSIKWPPVQKVAGDLYYSPELSQYENNYEVVNFVQSIHEAEL